MESRLTDDNNPWYGTNCGVFGIANFYLRRDIDNAKKGSGYTAVQMPDIRRNIRRSRGKARRGLVYDVVV
jgi:hypothetical protein